MKGAGLVAERPVFQRAPREFATPPQGDVEIVAPPAQPSPPTNSIVAIALPAVFAVLLLVVSLLTFSSNPLFAAVFSGFMLVSSVVAIINYWSQKTAFSRSLGKRKRNYESYLADVRRELIHARTAQREASRRTDPDPTMCVDRAVQRYPSLWERKPGHDDFLSLRLGIGKQPLSMAVKPPRRDPTADADPLLEKGVALAASFIEVDEVPIKLPVRSAMVAGIVGPRETALGSARCLLVQLATHHSPHEVKIVLLYPRDEAHGWEWARWLPHTWSDDRRTRYMANDAESARRLLSHLEDELARRKRLARDTSVAQTKAMPLPFFMFIVSDPTLLEDEPIGSYLVSRDEQLSVASLFLGYDRPSLPDECRAVVNLEDREFGLTLKANETESWSFEPDDISVDQADKFARALAPLRLEQVTAAADVPRSLSLCQLLGVQQADDLAVLTEWHRPKPPDLRVPIGIGKGGKTVFMDLYEGETHQGPHGLIAGTTRSGKTDLLQTVVASLALRFHPHELTFALIDYKGGAFVEPLRDLPHVLSSVTDLDGPEAALRALQGLEWEVSRREELRTEELRTKARLDHWESAGRGPWPQLVIIIDEFAELKRVDPDSIKRLIRIARQGGAFGIHLVLSTQTIDGVVDDEIRDNSRLRLCLRVLSEANSKAILNQPDATLLPFLPGRALLWWGTGDPEAFQGAWSGAPVVAAGSSDVQDEQVAEVRVSGERRWLTGTVTEAGGPSVRGTELEAVVRRINEISAREGIIRLGSLWTPPLPSNISLNQLRSQAGRSDGVRAPWLTPIVGLLDEPGEQRQTPLGVNLGADGHLIIYGAPGSGKTNLLHTLIVSLALDHPPDQLNMYLVDFAAKSLTLFGRMPHVGGVFLPDDQAERLGHLFRFLLGQMEERKQLLAEAGGLSYTAFRRTTYTPPPALVVVLDNYPAFATAFPDEDTSLQQILVEGGNLGIYVVLSASTPSSVRWNTRSMFKRSFCLHLTDRADYGQAIGPNSSVEPANLPGRGIIAGKPPMEFQAALPVEGTEADQRAIELQRLVAQMASEWKGPRPPALPHLPDVVALSSLLSPTVQWGGWPAAVSCESPIGLNLADLTPMQLRLDQGPHFLISGPPGSGKSTLLQSWLLGLATQLGPDQLLLFLVDFADSDLSALSELPHVRSLITRTDDVGNMMPKLVSMIEGRRTALENAKATGAAPNQRQWAAGQPAVVIAIDDFAALQAAPGVTLHLASLVNGAKGLGIHLMLAGGCMAFATGSGDPLVMLMKERWAGFVLGTTQFNDLEWLGIRLPPGETGKSLAAWQGFFGQHGKRPSRVKTATAWIGEFQLPGWVDNLKARMAITPPAR